MADQPFTTESQKTTGPLHKMLGQRIRDLRIQQGLSQSELAAACGFDTESLERIEQGELEVYLTTLLKLSLNLGVETSAILEGIC
jgi:transcriptional regulator with XRE-family HTH domain